MAKGKLGDAVASVLLRGAQNLAKNLGATVRTGPTYERLPSILLEGGKLQDVTLTLTPVGRDALRIGMHDANGDTLLTVGGIHDEIEVMEEIFEALKNWGVVRHSDRANLLQIAQVKQAKEKKDSWTEDFAREVGESIGIVWDEVSFTPATLLKGMKVELEHGTRNTETNITDDDAEETAKIAWAHLLEGPSYYEKLDELEKAVKAKKKGSVVMKSRYAAYPSLEEIFGRIPYVKGLLRKCLQILPGVIDSWAGRNLGSDDDLSELLSHDDLYQEIAMLAISESSIPDDVSGILRSPVLSGLASEDIQRALDEGARDLRDVVHYLLREFLEDLVVTHLESNWDRYV